MEFTDDLRALLKLPDEFKDKEIEDLRFLDENYVLAELQEYDQKFNRDIIMYYIFQVGRIIDND